MGVYGRVEMEANRTNRPIIAIDRKLESPRLFPPIQIVGFADAKLILLPAIPYQLLHRAFLNTPYIPITISLFIIMYRIIAALILTTVTLSTTINVQLLLPEANSLSPQEQ